VFGVAFASAEKRVGLHVSAAPNQAITLGHMTLRCPHQRQILIWPHPKAVCRAVVLSQKTRHAAVARCGRQGAHIYTMILGQPTQHQESSQVRVLSLLPRLHLLSRQVRNNFLIRKPQQPFLPKHFLRLHYILLKTNWV
jgi:hypothetical protein